MHVHFSLYSPSGETQDEGDETCCISTKCRLSGCARCERRKEDSDCGRQDGCNLPSSRVFDFCSWGVAGGVGNSQSKQPLGVHRLLDQDECCVQLSLAPGWNHVHTLLATFRKRKKKRNETRKKKNRVPDCQRDQKMAVKDRKMKPCTSTLAIGRPLDYRRAPETKRERPGERADCVYLG